MAAESLGVSPLVIVGSTVVVVWVLCSGALLKIGRGSKRTSKMRRLMVRLGGKKKGAGMAWIAGLVICGIGFGLYMVHTQLIPLHILVGAFTVYDKDERTWKQNLKTGAFGDLRENFKSWTKSSGTGDNHYSFWKSELLWNSGQYFIIGMVVILALCVFGFVFFRLIGSSSGQYYHARTPRRRQGSNYSSSARLPVVGVSVMGSNARMPIVPPSMQPGPGQHRHQGQRRGPPVRQRSPRPEGRPQGATRSQFPTQPR